MAVTRKKSTVKKATSQKKPVAKKVTKAAPKKTAAPKKKAVTNKKTVTKKTPVKKAVGGKPAVKKTTTQAKTTQKSKLPIRTDVTVFSLADIPPYQEKMREKYMNDTQLSHFGHILNVWKEQLMEEVDRTVAHMKHDANIYPDPSDRASQEEEFSLELRTRDRERKLIRKIEEALQRITDKEYGYCDVCGIDIGIRRLEARPTATLCIDCKTLDEIKERQLGG